jgi:uncharacterized protein (TIGR00251 family)
MTACQQVGDDVLVRVKAVPGATRNTIVGILGDRLKIVVNAPPERGQANRAIEQLLAKALHLPKGRVVVERGRTSPLKVVRIQAVDLTEVVATLPM